MQMRYVKSIIYPNVIRSCSSCCIVRELIGILRACILSGELSDRVFRLTTSIIMLNTGFISAW